MNFCKLTEEEYQKYWNKHPMKTFLSTIEIGKLREKSNWKVDYVGVKENKKIVAATMLLSHKRKFNKYEFYSPRGYLLDFNNKELLKYFTKELKKYLKENNAYVFRVDPYLIYKERDIDGNIVEDGIDNSQIVNNLYELGFKKVPSKNLEQVSWMFSLDLEDKTEEQILKEMKPNTRNIIRKTEKFGINVKEISYDEDNIIYNDFRNNEFCAVIKNINDQSERVICAPLANISKDRKWGLSINFARVWDFRPGYGYCNLKDDYYNVNAPETDGIFLVDIEKNISKLIINYKQLTELFPEKPFCEMKLLVNHITFNPSASRFLFLLRNFPEEGKRWGTILITADRDGGNIKNLTNYEVNSHYDWKNDEEIIIYSGLPEWGIYFINDKTKKREKLDDDLINYDDIHCLYSPDRSCFIGDGYPNTGSSRYMMLYDFESKKSRAIVKIYSHPVDNTDIRCDLHNRFNRDGSMVSFDSFHSCRREIMAFKFDKRQILG